MAPYVPEEVDVFTVPHSRMKDLVNDYVEMLQTTNFSNFADLKLLLDSLRDTFKEFKLHEQIENNLIMKRLKNKLKALSIRNTLVCNCHKDTHLTDMLSLVQEGFGKKNQQDRLNYSLQLKKSLEEFTEDFIPHMKQEEEVFQPLLLEYFSYEELCELKRKVIDYHSHKAAEVEKGLREAKEKLEITDPNFDGEDEEEEDDGCQQVEQERLEQERLDNEHLEQERLEKKRLEQEQLVKEHLEQEQLVKEHLEQERLEKERLEQERLEKERLEQEQLEQERLEKEWLEQEQLERVEVEAVQPTTVLDLPPEVMSQVFSYLNPQEVVQCGQVCHQWNQLALEPSLWVEVHPTKWAEGNWKAKMQDVDYDLEEEEQEDGVGEEEGYTAIDDDADIDESEPADSEGDPYQSEYSRRVHRQAEILLGLVKYVLPSTGHSLKVLNLGHCHALTNGMLQRLLKLTPNVEYLNLAGTRISDFGLKGLGKSWCGANLRHLNLSGCGNITDTTLERVANALSGQLLEPVVLTKPCWCEQQRLEVTCHQDHPSFRDTDPICVNAGDGGRSDADPNAIANVKVLDNEAEREEFESNTSPPSDKNGVPMEDQPDKTSGEGCTDGCHVHCSGHEDYPEPDPIEDCARSVCVSTGSTLGNNLLPPVGETIKLVSVPPDDGRVDCINNNETAACPKGQLFVEDVFEAQDRKPQKLLTYLNLSGCHQLTDYGISTLAAAGPLLHLTHLDLSGCVAMTGDGLRPLIGMCPALIHDTLFYCDNILDGPYADTASGCQNVVCARRVCCRKET